MASTSARTQAREAARARKAAADAERRRSDQIELDAATKFAVAYSEREAADARAAEQVRRLDELPETRTDRIAMLLNVSRAEIARLRKLVTLQSEDGSGGDEDEAADEQSAGSPTVTENTASASAEPARTSEQSQDGGQVSSAAEAAPSEPSATG